RLAHASSARREAPFAFTLPSAGELLLTGVLDFHCDEHDSGVLVVDYKSDRLAGRLPSEVVEGDYAIQRAVYALAVLSSGVEAVEVAYCFLERPDEIVAATFTSADVPALSETVAAAAAGVLAESWPVAASPHRMLCGDCPGRRVLCSHPESLTLREPAAVHSGTAAPAERSASGSSALSGAEADTED
ncbi:MAG: PD-(D/E)XK nuclease family protein, partial [Solirubrobacterales bacterium]|nr:PD-(D/E)XK nuclease family protein [Solirubrobacterales bacterium]